MTIVTNDAYVQGDGSGLLSFPLGRRKSVTAWTRPIWCLIGVLKRSSTVITLSISSAALKSTSFQGKVSPELMIECDLTEYRTPLSLEQYFQLLYSSFIMLITIICFYWINY